MLDDVPRSAFHRLTQRDTALLAGLRWRLAGHPTWLQELAAMEERVGGRLVWQRQETPRPAHPSVFARSCTGKVKAQCADQVPPPTLACNKPNPEPTPKPTTIPKGLKCDIEALYSNGGFEALHTLLARRILRGQYL
jgi:hypothetical protein